MTGVLRSLLTLGDAGSGRFVGVSNGPAGKRAYGGHVAAQAFAAACRTADTDMRPTSLHMQFLRAGDAATGTRYDVESVYDGRTSASRRVLAAQEGRLLLVATASFARPAEGPAHGRHTATLGDPGLLDATGPIGSAPSLPLDEIDIRIVDDWRTGEFVRRLWWRVDPELGDDPVLHACAAVYVTDIYGVDPILRVHGHSMVDRSHRAATTDSSIWFHRPIRADQWNLLESRSPAAARGRGVITANLFDVGGFTLATLVQEGMAIPRE